MGDLLKSLNLASQIRPTHHCVMMRNHLRGVLAWCIWGGNLVGERAWWLEVVEGQVSSLGLAPIGVESGWELSLKIWIGLLACLLSMVLRVDSHWEFAGLSFFLRDGHTHPTFLPKVSSPLTSPELPVSLWIKFPINSNPFSARLLEVEFLLLVLTLQQIGSVTSLSNDISDLSSSSSWTTSLDSLSRDGTSDLSRLRSYKLVLLCG